MRLIPNWKEVLLDAWSMRAAWGLAWILIFPEIAYAVLGFDIVSPYVKWCLAVLWLFGSFAGRVIDQGISTNTRIVPDNIIWQRVGSFALWFVVLTSAMVLLSIGGWLWAIVSQ